MNFTREYILYFLLLVTILSCSKNAAINGDSATSSSRILVSIERNTRPFPNDTVNVVLEWGEIVKRMPAAKEGISVVDQHFGNPLDFLLYDIDNDGKTDHIHIAYPFTTGEPVYTLMIRATPVSSLITSEKTLPSPTPGLSIRYLVDYNTFTQQHTDTITRWPQRIFETSMKKYPDPEMFTIISPDEWTYEHGFFLNGGFELWKATNDSSYFKYVKAWVDHYLNDDGTIRHDKYDVSQYRLDDILPGRLCIFLYEATKDVRYKHGADQLIRHLEQQPKTSEGGYWHKNIYPYQMWLDGIYMADVFSMQYAAAFQEPHWFDEAAHQIKIISRHTTDTATGLMYHGWDESKNPVWADSTTGTSPEFWGRAIGWYLMALIDCLDYLPESHPDRAEIANIFQRLARSLIQYQDKEKHLWYQVVDKGKQEGNWIEVSSSAMFAYGFAKGYHKRLLTDQYYRSARLAFDSIIMNYVYFDDGGDIHLNQTVKVGTLNPKVSKGDFDYYVSTERRLNDYKGLAALLYAALELNRNHK